MSVISTIIMTVALLGAGMVEEMTVLAMSQLSRKVDERPGGVDGVVATESLHTHYDGG